MLLLVMGCDNFYMMCSLNPFYLGKCIIISPELEGSWVAKPVNSKKDSCSSSPSKIWSLTDTASVWRIRRYISKMAVKDKKGKDSTTFKPENYYIAKLVQQTDSESYQFKVVLFKVNKGLYADFIPYAKEELFKSRLASGSYFEVHTLARVTLVGSKMDLSWLGAGCMKEMIEQKRVRVNYQWVNETGRFLLSASSDDLTAMIDRYGDQPRFLDWENQQARLKLTRLN